MQQTTQSNNYCSAADDWRSRRIYLVGALGTVIEWYDFALYGALAHIFANQFFNHANHQLALMLTYLIFFISYLTRPLGGLIYGLIGDFFGRRLALLLSIFLMTVSMFVIAGAPTWQTLGTAAPLILIICRIIQGLSAGGERTGSLVYVLESVGHNRQGFYGALILSVAWMGGISAMLMTVTFMHLLSSAQFFAWGWRMAYLIGGAAGLIIFALRLAIPESIEFEEAKIKKQQQHKQEMETITFKKALVRYWPTVLVISSLFALSGTIDTSLFSYLPQYMHQYFSLPLATGWMINIFFALIGIVAMLIFGVLSDKIGRKRLLTIGACCFLFFSYPLLSLLSIGQSYIAVAILILLSIGLAIYEGPLPALVVKLPPLQVRYTVFALGYNIAAAVFAGSSPLICAMLARLSPLAPAFYFMALAALSLIVLYCLGNRQTMVTEQDELAQPEHAESLPTAG